MSLFRLMVSKVHRNFGAWFRRNIMTVVIFGCLGFIIYAHIQRSSTAKDAHHVRDERPAYQWINSSHKTVLSVNKLTDNEKFNAYPSDGYKRAAFLKKACANLQGRPEQVSSRVRVSYDIDHRTLFCPFCKIASTFWTRVFKMLEKNKQGILTRHPFEVPISQAPRSELYFDLLSQKISVGINAHNSFRFLFVRHPYSLLFSAYVDKIVGPNPYFWKAFGQQKYSKTTCGDDLTFEQFLRSIIDTYKRKRVIDCHVATFDACQPCRMNYTFVAKMETFKTDTMHILSKLNQTQTLEVFENSFSGLHADDAIDDSTSGPYSWKEEITKCIPWYKALQRIWRKLQIRGVIGMDAFSLSNEEANGITKKDFIKILQKERQKTTSSERHWQKEQALKEAYRNVSNDILNEIKKIYEREFLLFDYDDSPVDILNKDVPLQYYGFMDYSTITKKIQ